MTPRPLLYLHTYSLRFHFQYKSGFDVFAFIDRAADERYDGVCISANDPGYRHLGGKDPERFAEIRSRLQQLGLLCDIDTSGTDPMHLLMMLEVAEIIGAQGVRTYTCHRGTPTEIAVQTIKDLRAIAPVAREKRIRLMLENHEVQTGPEIAQVLLAVDDPWVGALFDYGNSQMVMEDPLDALEAMAPCAMSAHIKDHVMLRPEQSPDGRLSVLGVPIGAGNLPIEELTARLLNAGCRRLVVENSWGYRAAVKDSRLNESNITRLGHGAFRFAESPLSNERYMLRPELFPPDDLVRREDESHHRSMKVVTRLLSASVQRPF